jgi:HD superfamily phosphodiesterase
VVVFRVGASPSEVMNRAEFLGEQTRNETTCGNEGIVHCHEVATATLQIQKQEGVYMARHKANLDYATS